MNLHHEHGRVCDVNLQIVCAALLATLEFIFVVFLFSTLDISLFYCFFATVLWSGDVSEDILWDFDPEGLLVKNDLVGSVQVLDCV